MADQPNANQAPVMDDVQAVSRLHEAYGVIRSELSKVIVGQDRAIERMLEAGVDFRRFGSGAMGLASVADGRADAYLELHINSWDCLAGILLVEEAGGRVNDFLANDGLRRGNPILACAPGVADAIAKLAGVPLLP